MPNGSRRGSARTPSKRASLRSALEAIDPEAVVAVLEPLVTERRRERILQVGAARLDSVTLVMDAPHDPHNGAAMLRSCDAFGVQRVHVVERHESFAASNAVSKGAERWVDVMKYRDVDSAVAALTHTGHVLVGTHPEGELEPQQLAELPRVALVMGNEHDGISQQLAASCSARVRVPMRGYVESLNVSVSAAILLSYATAGRAGDLPTAERRRLYARGLVLTVPRALDVLLASGVELPL